MRLPCLILAAALALAGCDSERRGEERDLIDPEAGGTSAVQERDAVRRDIAALARGKDPAQGADMAAYDAAVARLIARGSRVESEVVDQLRRSEDWAVRLGLVEVLQGIGTRLCVPHLIAVLDDPQPLVALRATTTLRELCQHREIPEAGAAAGANGLPPVPERDPGDLAMDAELRLWSAWFREYGHRHRLAWERWWEANRDTVVVK